MARSRVENILGSGLVLQLQPDASSKLSAYRTHEPGSPLTPTLSSRALVNANEPHLRVYSTGDGPDVYEDRFFDIAKPSGETFHPTLILVGTRLGIDKITPVYWDALIAALQMPQSIGIAG